MFYVVYDLSKHREEGIAKESRNMVNGFSPNTFMNA